MSLSLSDHLTDEQLLLVRKVMLIKILTDAKKAAEKKNRSRSMWVNPFLTKRPLYDIEECLLKDLIWGDNSNFKNFTRLLPEQFDDILIKITPAIERRDTQMRQAITPRVKLAITLRFVATGDSYRSLESLSRISKSTISLFVPEVLKAIYETLQPMYLKYFILYNSLKGDTLNIPTPSPLPDDKAEIPYFFVGDDAFQLDRNLMKPYSRCLNLTTRKKIYNYRLCRARMTVECAFGRLASSFRIFHRPIEVKLTTVDLIIKACCVLHNYKIQNKSVIISGEKLNQEDLVADSFPETVTPIGPQFTGENYRQANKIQEKITNYCIGPGDLSFQWKKIGLDNVE